MQAAQITLKQYGHGRTVALRPKELTAQVSGWITRLFGCWHVEMSRPFTRDGESYRACLECGARRKFDSTRWEMVGAYYYDEPKNQLPWPAAPAALHLKARATAPSL
jgi:hypothetical protein